MATLTYFTLTGVLNSAPGGPVFVSDPPPNPVYGDAIITPLVTTGDAFQADTLIPPSVLFLPPTRGVKFVAGVLTYCRAPGVLLVANTAALALSGDLFYKMTFTNLVSRGEPLQLKAVTFAAPTTATTIDLVDVIQAPGSPATGELRGPPGAPVDDVQFVGPGTIAFYVNGVAIGDPIVLPGATGTTTIDGGTP